jgi:two-component system LytT family response regulator
VRALIVDDEPLARRGVILRLRRFKDVEVIGECGDGASAVEKVMNLSPDVVFLDVQMPGMDGFDVLRALPMEKLPAVIFLTAHEHHALRAFEFHALDYLLKPLHDERFAAAINRARKLMDSTFEWIGAAGDYVELHVSGRCHLFRETMASLERRLDPAKFIRIHRSRIIQVANIVELQSIDNREFTVKVSDGSEHRASRTYADRLERWLSSGRT